MIMRLLPSSSACPTRWLAPILRRSPLCCSAAVSAVGTVEAGSDFHVVAASADTQKYLTYGWNGWNGKTIHWRYNDSNRSTAAAGTADAALNAILRRDGQMVCRLRHHLCLRRHVQQRRQSRHQQHAIASMSSPGARWRAVLPGKPG